MVEPTFDADTYATQDIEVSSFMEENRNEVEAYIHEVEWKSLQGGCMGEESEYECTSIFFVGDI